MRIAPHQPSRRMFAQWLVLSLLTLLSVSALAADLGTAKTGTEADTRAVSAPVAAPTDKPKQCYNGCQSWGQICNVDPRGVYKCQRRCEKFGKICE